MIANEEFYFDNMDDLLQAMLNKGKLQEDIKNAQPLGPQPAKVGKRFRMSFLLCLMTTGKLFRPDGLRLSGRLYSMTKFEFMFSVVYFLIML